ncbi:MAG: hypothetical protein MK008_04305 [Bdellovibrionales bacterium]|nr:hypothetical protein [Bdellovibrionales bacterium]
MFSNTAFSDTSSGTEDLKEDSGNHLQQNSSSHSQKNKDWQADLAIMNIDRQGSVTTLMPMLGKNLWEKNNFDLSINLGVSFYKYNNGDHLIISLVNLKPTYHFKKSKLSLSAIIGTQFWEYEEAYVDTGLSLAYSTIEHTNLFDKLFILLGQVESTPKSSYLGFGISKNF